MGFIRFAKEMSQTHGCASVCLGGEPKLLSSEYFVDDLRKVIGDLDMRLSKLWHDVHEK